jgi:hypothetical protein
MSENIREKSTNAEYDLRVNKVMEMILKGQSRISIVQNISKNYNITFRQADNYIADATKKIKESANKDAEQNISITIERYRDLYYKSYQLEDYAECRRIQESLVKLLGISEPEKTSVLHTGTEDIQPIKVHIVDGSNNK